MSDSEFVAITALVQQLLKAEEKNNEIFDSIKIALGLHQTQIASLAAVLTRLKARIDLLEKRLK